MRRLTAILSAFILTIFGRSQDDKSLQRILKTMNKESVPYISVADASRMKATFLDAREASEYGVSHIEDAVHVGYKNFNMKLINDLNVNKTDTLIVYCSIGVRSEDIGEKLKEAGFKNVYNLYGGIFEWKNLNYPVYSSTEQITDSVHAYSKYWSRFLHTGVKVYE
jgi:rhodanese-related sulfurtransferase